MSSPEASGHAAIARWAESGAMALTGTSDGPPIVAPGDVAGMVGTALGALAEAAGARTGWPTDLPDCRLLGERAALAGLRRRAPFSCGGAFRTLPTLDGHVGVSLARQEDLLLLPALVESELLSSRLDTWLTDRAGPDYGGRAAGWIWDALADWSRTLRTDEAAARAELFCLPTAAVPAGDPASPDAALPGSGPDWGHGARVIRQGGARRLTEHPLVVDLTALWAGPLCAHLLGLSGARVVKVEATTRPDGARRGPAAFFDLLHGGHATVAVDFASLHDRDRLRELVARADLVLEGSRPRALRQLGLIAEEMVDAGTSWLSITARGRESQAVGFGDDVAVAAGLFHRLPDGTPVPCGDALADPLTGVVAAAAAAQSLLRPYAEMVEVSMFHVAAAARSVLPAVADHRVVVDSAGWMVEHGGGRDRVVEPTARRVSQPAREFDADTAEILA